MKYIHRESRDAYERLRTGRPLDRERDAHRNEIPAWLWYFACGGALGTAIGMALGAASVLP